MTDTQTFPAPDPTLDWAGRVILRTEVGSTAHGTGLPDQEDYDELGVMALPWQHTLGIPIRADRSETITYRPGRAEGERSQPGDYDLVVHSARKFANLAASGNPSVLMALFGPLRYANGFGHELRSDYMIQAFWSQMARPRFLGYAQTQRERLQGTRGGAHTNRPELVEQHGYDTKYAMHMLRLGYQGIEYMSTGRLVLPIGEPHGEMLRAVRRGEIPMDEVIDLARTNESTLMSMDSAAPEGPDLKTINWWLRDVHEWSVKSNSRT